MPITPTTSFNLQQSVLHNRTNITQTTVSSFFLSHGPEDGKGKNIYAKGKRSAPTPTVSNKRVKLSQDKEEAKNVEEDETEESGDEDEDVEMTDANAVVSRQWRRSTWGMMSARAMGRPGARARGLPSECEQSIK